ncbi:MAG: type II toxin-antitoxin system Phd/YefM family antitoxin [Sphingobium sp.]
METVNIHEAKTHLSRLLDRLVSSGGFIIAKAGTPIAKIVPLSVPDERTRLGFMAGQLRIPPDFDSMGAAEIEALFDGRP